MTRFKKTVFTPIDCCDDRRCRNGACRAVLLLVLLATGCRSGAQPDAETSRLTSSGIKAISTTAEDTTTEKRDVKKSQIDILLALASTHEQHQKLPAAMAAYEKVLQKDPQHLIATHRLALLHDREGNVEQSDQYFARCLEIEPGNADVLADLAYQAYLRKDFERASEYCRQGLVGSPNHARLHNNYALVLTQSEQYREAFTEFRTGGCSRAEAFSNLGHLCAIEQRWEQAQKFLAIAARDERPSQTARETLAMLWPHGDSAPARPADASLVSFEERISSK